MSIPVPNTFNPGDSVSSQKINADFAEFANAVDVNGDTMLGTLTTQDVVPDGDGTRDLGASGTKYRKLFVEVMVPTVASSTSSATPAPNAGTTMVYELTALAVDATFTNPSGTPSNGQQLLISITDDNLGARALSWGTAYVDGGTALPTTTVQGKHMYVGFIYNSGLSKWLCVGVQVAA